MDSIQITMLAVLCLFYLAYLGKILLLRRQGIRGNVMGKGEKPKAALLVELSLRGVTLVGALIQFACVLFPALVFALPAAIGLRWAGVVLALIGCAFFIVSVATMKSNWRAGFNSDQKTELVTSGIYRFSRNPAFFGFDLLYIGCALAQPGILTIAMAILAPVLFHLQIKGEEAYLRGVFGQPYRDYAAQVRRYLGRRKMF